MKRLQFRNHDELFDSRSLALKYFDDIVDTEKIACQEFGNSLYAEPMVAKYLDEDGNTQLILAIGVDSGNTAYHIIDTAKIIEDINSNKESIEEGISNLEAKIEANKVKSKDIKVEYTASGAELTYFADEITISKETNVDYTDGYPRLKSLLTIEEVTPTEASIKAQYELQDKNGNTIGTPIKIKKESALSEVKIGKLGDVIDPTTGNIISHGTGDDALNFIYLKSDGTYELVAIEISKYFTDAHFGNGLNNQDGVVSIKEGDGNEYLVVGEDSISVVGVKADIETAKDKAIEDSNAYTDNKVADAKESFNEQLDSVTGSINSLTETLNSSIENLTNTVNSSVSDLNNTINTEKTNRETADSDILSKIDNVNASIDDIKDSYALKADVDTEIAHTKEDIENEIGITSGMFMTTISSVSASTDLLISAIEDEIKAAENIKVVDVVYGKDADHPSFIQLKLADGTYTTGFDASDFLIDSVLTSVSLDGDNLVFIWNDDANTKISVPLNKFIDVYTSADENYIKIEGNVIKAVVDGDGGLVKTLASTSYVDNAIANVNDEIASAKTYSTEIDNKISALSGNVATKINDLENGFNATSGSIVTTMNAISGSIVTEMNALSNNVNTISGTIVTEMNAISGSIVTEMNAISGSIATEIKSVSNDLNTADNTIATQVSANTDAIKLLNEDALTTGSIAFIVNDKISHALITDGIAPEDASHSLARTVDGYSGTTKYYISSKATDMYYVKADGTLVGLNEYITSLEEKVTELENNLVSKIQEVIDAYVTGTDKQIKVENGKIGFADDAVFGEI